MAPKINPGGLRRPLRSQVGAQRLQKSLPEAAGSSKNKFWNHLGRPGGDKFPGLGLPWATAGALGRGRGGVGTPKKVTFSRL